MRDRISSWLLFWTMTVGVLLIMIGSRPTLQGVGDHSGSGPIIKVIGHSLTWPMAGVLTVRLVRSTRASLREEQQQRELEYERATAQTKRPPPDMV